MALGGFGQALPAERGDKQDAPELQVPVLFPEKDSIRSLMGARGVQLESDGGLNVAS